MISFSRKGIYASLGHIHIKQTHGFYTSDGSRLIGGHHIWVLLGREAVRDEAAAEGETTNKRPQTLRFITEEVLS